MSKSAAKELLEKWLRFLAFANNEKENRELLSEYFFHEFARAPEDFYRFLEFLEEKVEGDVRLAQGYLGIISQLSERFGFFEEKHKLDNLCFKVVDLEGYQEIDEYLQEYERKSRDFLDGVLVELTILLEGAGFSFDIKGRFKNIYSIHRKLERSGGRDISSLRDIFAFRIVLEGDEQDCFEALNLLHDNFDPIVDSFKDYITVPKINGYQSLHTGLNGVLPGLDLPVEVQIRTDVMDEFAERGLAAHWIYSEDKSSKMVTEKEQRLLDYFSFLSADENGDQVYFFSHKGDIFKLEKGSTALDFAYHIHSGLGNKTKAALVNKAEKPLYYEINEGDSIEIVKGEEKTACREWLEFVNNKSTLKKIHAGI